jgi:hypothetical protein
MNETKPNHAVSEKSKSPTKKTAQQFRTRVNGFLIADLYPENSRIKYFYYIFALNIFNKILINGILSQVTSDDIKQILIWYS